LKALLAALVMVGVFGLAIARLSVPSTAPRFVAAVFPPWWSSARAIESAATAGAVAGVGAFRFVVILAPITPAYEARLTRAGAWLIIDPRVPRLCGSQG